MINMGELFAHDRIGNLQMDRVPLADRDPERDLLEPGDLLFARQSLVAAGAGKVSIFTGADEPVTFESHIIRARPDPEMAAPSFLFLFFQSSRGKTLMGSIVNQVSAAGIRGSDLVELRLPLPTLKEQRAIASVLGALDDKIESNRRLVAMQRRTRSLRFAHAYTTRSQRVPLVEIAEHVKGSVQPSATPDEPFEQFSIPAFDAEGDPEICLGRTMASGKTPLPSEPVVLISEAESTHSARLGASPIRRGSRSVLTGVPCPATQAGRFARVARCLRKSRRAVLQRCPRRCNRDHGQPPTHKAL